MIRVSVIIPCHNGFSFIRTAIDSVLSQGISDLEIIVADDGSTDGSADLVAAYGPPVHLVTVGHGNTQATRNAAIAASSGEFIALLDQDDAWLPNKLERQLAHFASDPAIGLCYTDTRGVDPQGHELDQLHNPLQIPRDQTEALGLLLRINCMAASTVVIRRSVFDRVGPFDSTFHLAGDWDLWLRIVQDYPITAEPSVLLNYCWHSDNESHRRIALLQESIAVQQNALERIAQHPRWSAEPKLMPFIAKARRKLASRHSELGMRLARDGSSTLAMVSHRQAIRLAPLELKLWWRLARTVFRVSVSNIRQRG